MLNVKCRFCLFLSLFLALHVSLQSTESRKYTYRRWGLRGILPIIFDYFSLYFANPLSAFLFDF